METLTLTRADVLAEAARRYRKRYGGRLEELYVLPAAPFEPEEDDESFHFVLLLSNFEPFAESDMLAEIADEIMQTFGYQIGVFAHDAPVEGDELALRAREEGVRL